MLGSTSPVKNAQGEYIPPSMPWSVLHGLVQMCRRLPGTLDLCQRENAMIHHRTGTMPMTPSVCDFGKPL